MFEIRSETLTVAAARGFFPQIRGNEEIAIAFRPDFFATYAEQMESLHQTAKHAADVKNLETIAASEKKVEIKDVPARAHARRCWNKFNGRFATRGFVETF